MEQCRRQCSFGLWAGEEDSKQRKVTGLCSAMPTANIRGTQFTSGAASRSHHVLSLLKRLEELAPLERPGPGLTISSVMGVVVGMGFGIACRTKFSAPETLPFVP